jgi:hypothetical protein
MAALPRGGNKSRQICVSCGKQKPVSGGENCGYGHFNCRDCAIGHTHCRICGCSLRRTQNSRSTADESNRTHQLAKLFAFAAATLGTEEKAAQWLKTPNRALRGGCPLDQLDTDPGVREVEDILGRISYGVYS